MRPFTSRVSQEGRGGRDDRRFLAAGAARAGRQSTGMPIGSQTYPHRQMIKDGNFAGLLKALADIGVRASSCCAARNSDFASLSDGKPIAAIIRDHGLTCESAHFSMRGCRRQAESIAWARLPASRE